MSPVPAKPAADVRERLPTALAPKIRSSAAMFSQVMPLILGQ